MADRQSNGDDLRKVYRTAVNAYLAVFPPGSDPAPHDWVSDWIPRYPIELAEELREFHIGQIRKRRTPSLSGSSEPANPTGTLADVEFDTEQKEGVMGVVRLGKDCILNRPIAVKQPKPAYAKTPRARRRFFREAQFLGRLQHPNIPPVYQYGRDADGSPFFTMRWVKGRSLEELRKAMNSSENLSPFITYFYQICQAVGHAHTVTILHRDLKPENVVIEMTGTVYVVDWGIGKMLDEEPDASEAAIATPTPSSSGMHGTPAYMAPEQARSEMKIGPTADVFALGGILCFILTGRAPEWVGKPSDRGLDPTIKGGPVWQQLEARRSEYPELVDLAIKCLAKEPSVRPRDGNAVAAEVQKYLIEITDRLILAVREKADREKKDEREASRRRLGWVLVCTLLPLIGLVAVGTIWQYSLVERNGKAIEDLLDGCEKALRRGDTDVAKAALAEVDRRESVWGIRNCRERRNACERTLTLLEELQRIDEFRWIPTEGNYPKMASVSEQWAKACGAYGIVPGATRAQEAALTVNSSLVDFQLLTALHLWLVNAPSEELRNILKAADPDPFREGIREAIVEGNVPVLQQRIGQMKTREQPDWFAAAVGQIRAIPINIRKDVLEQAFMHSSSNLTLAMSLGGCYRINQRRGSEDRVRWFQAAAAAHPGSMAAHHNLGIALGDKGDLNGAIREYNKALELAPGDASTHTNLGVVLKNKGDLKGAIEEHEIAIGIEPGFASAHNNLGIALSDKGDVAGAIREFECAIECDRKYARPHYHLGLILQKKGDLDGAMQKYKLAIDLDSKFAAPHNAKGNVLKARGELDDAIGEYKSAIAIDPEFADAHHNLGSALYSKGDREGAIEEFYTAISLNPEFAGPHDGLGVVLQAKGDLIAARQEFEIAIRIDGNSAHAHSNFGKLLHAQNDLRGAIREYKKAIHIDHSFAPPHYNLGLVLQAQGDLDGAIREYRRAIELDEALPQPHHFLGNALYTKAKTLKDGKGGLDEVIREYQKAVSLKSRFASTYNDLASLLATRGEAFEGLRILRSGLRIDPQFISEFRYNLACCACLVASGENSDSPMGIDRRRMRCDALGWLTDELEAQYKKYTDNARTASDVHSILDALLKDTDLQAVRTLEKLPESERDDWKQFWVKVNQLWECTAIEIAPSPRLR